VAEPATPATLAEALLLLGKEREVSGLLAARVESLGRELAQMRGQMELLLRRLYGRSSEKCDPNQLWLDALVLQADAQDAPAPEPTPAAETPVAAHVRKRDPHGRGAIPAHLPREVVELDVPEAEKTLPDGTPRPRVGHEDSERIAYEPSRLFVKVLRRPKYGSPAGAEEHGVVVAPLPERLVPRCLADESLLAHVVVSKFADHLPAYRLEGILKRSGLDVARQTLCGWTKAVGLGVEPLALAVRKELFATGLVHSDDTPVDLLEDHRDKPRGKRIREARFWVARSSPRDGPWTVFDFTESRAAAGPERFFAGYRASSSATPTRATTASTPGTGASTCAAAGRTSGATSWTRTAPAIRARAPSSWP
jgi:transposase